MIRDESVYKGGAYKILLRVDPYHRDIDPDTPCGWHRLRDGLLDKLDEQRDFVRRAGKILFPFSCLAFIQL